MTEGIRRLKIALFAVLIIPTAYMLLFSIWFWLTHPTQRHALSNAAVLVSAVQILLISAPFVLRGLLPKLLSLSLLAPLLAWWGVALGRDRFAWSASEHIEFFITSYIIVGVLWAVIAVAVWVVQGFSRKPE